MINRAIRFLLLALKANLLKVNECNHRTPLGGQAFAEFRHNGTNHVFICTQCGLIEREIGDPEVTAKYEEMVKKAAHSQMN